MKKPPTKLETFADALVRRRSMNTFEANSEYGDTCLHSTVSMFQKRFSIPIDRNTEQVKNRYGKYVTVTRYSVRDIEEMKQLLERLRKTRRV